MILRDRRHTEGSAANGAAGLARVGAGAARPAASTGAEDGGAEDGGAVEVFMLRRAATMAFAPRMMVFPGGGVDERDADLDLPWAGPSPAEWGRTLVADEATARGLVVAAVREVFEECGVLLAGPDTDSLVGDVSGSQWQAERAALSSHEMSLAEMLGSHGLVLRSDLLRARSRWITPEFEPRRYDTRIFAALLPFGQIADDQTSEADHADWADPAGVLRGFIGGSIAMLPPTAVCLEQLAAAPSADDFLAADPLMAAITPSLAQVDGAVVIRCRLSLGQLTQAGT